MRRCAPLALAALVALSGCRADIAAPELSADPSLTFEAAHARWLAARPADYSFEFEAQGAMKPSPGFYRARILNGRLVQVNRAYSGEIAPIELGFTIDQLWDRLVAAKSTGTPLSGLEFSLEGIPMQATVGSLAADGGMRYQLRSYVIGRYDASQ